MGGPSVRATRPLVRGKSRAFLSPLLAAVVVLSIMPAAAAGPARDASSGGSHRDSYIVVLEPGRDSATEIAQEHSRRFGARVSHIFETALRGYSAELPPGAVEGIQHDIRVRFVEQDQQVSASAQGVPTGVARVFALSNASSDIDATDDARVEADVAILDTGIDLDHPDLNVVSSVDCTAASSPSMCVAGAGRDDNGHGTHVAGTAAAVDNGLGVVGVAPGARLHAVKVLSATGIGLLSSVIAGIDWVTAHADIIEVGNMSLGCRCPSAALDLALSTAVDRGVIYTAAAGNSSADASTYFPAAHPDVIAVSAIADFDGAAGGHGTRSCRMERDDTLAVFSNWGPAVDVAAPGFCILSTSLLGTYETLSGTSMAAPHVAGAAALLAAGSAKPQDEAGVLAIKNRILEAGNFDWIDESGDGIHEPLLDLRTL